jgi:hypothetical protein
VQEIWAARGKNVYYMLRQCPALSRGGQAVFQGVKAICREGRSKDISGSKQKPNRSSLAVNLRLYLALIKLRAMKISREAELDYYVIAQTCRDSITHVSAVKEYGLVCSTHTRKLSSAHVPSHCNGAL